MKNIWAKNKGFFENVAGTTSEKNFAVICPNGSSPFGLLQQQRSAALKPLKIAPLFPAGFALHSTVSATQRFHAAMSERT